MQRQRLAQQMRVRRKIERKIILQMAAMLIELAEPFHAELRNHLVACQVIDPDPRHRPETHFQRAGPIDPAMIRIRREPAFELRANLLQVRRISTQAERLRQKHEMLMPIRFPNHFMIAPAPGVQIRNAAEISKTGFDAAGMIAPPRNVWAGIDDQAEDRKAMLSNLFGKCQNFRGKCGSLECGGNRRRIGKF